MPGSLFIGYLLFPLQGFVWSGQWRRGRWPVARPAVSSMSFLRFWRCALGHEGVATPRHSRSFTSDLQAREAEKALEPLGMSLGHDYMGGALLERVLSHALKASWCSRSPAA